MEFNYIKVTFKNVPFAVLKITKGSFEELHLVDSLIDNGFKLEPCTKRLYDKLVSEDKVINVEDIEDFDFDNFLE